LCEAKLLKKAEKLFEKREKKGNGEFLKLKDFRNQNSSKV